jgi:hypothetical protein
MTLILSIITDEYIVQVSDRRLTRFDGSVFDDGTNKVLSWCGMFSIAFTGIAFIDRKQTKPTLEWVQETLRSAKDIEPAIELLRSGLQTKLAVLPNAWDKRLALSMVGWALRDGALVPVSILISNFHANVNGQDLALYKHRSTVEAYIFPLESAHRGFLFHTFGAPVDENVSRYLRRGLQRLVASPRNSSRRAGQLATQILRLVAHTQKTVGTDVTVMAMPKTNTSPGAVSTSAFGAPNASEATFEAVSAVTNERTSFSPAYVCGGLALSNMTVHLSADGKTMEMKMRIDSFPDLSGANPLLPAPPSSEQHPTGFTVDLPDGFF